MSRPLRIEFAEALYHVTSRGDHREDIYVDDQDRREWLSVLGQTCERFNWRVWAYCLMSNHYHVLLETPEASLSSGMRHLNGVYTQRANHRHRRVGHVFQGRYKAVLVDREAHLLELARYVVLNRVRAGMVSDAAAWRWSSYSAMLDSGSAPAWLLTDALLSRFGRTRQNAVTHFEAYVRAGVAAPSVWRHLRQQVYLGDEAFVTQALRRAEASDTGPNQEIEVPRAQRRAPALPLPRFAAMGLPRDEAMTRAYATGAYTLAEIAQVFGVHYATVSRAVRRHEAGHRA